MRAHDYKDILGGLLLIVVGLFFGLQALWNYDLGTMRRMGPGMFPAMVGGLLVGFGVILLISGWFRRGEWPVWRIWSPLFVLSGVATFAVLIGPFGLIPAVVGVVAVSSLAELRVRPVPLAILAGMLSVLAWVVFRLGLGLAMPPFAWPF
ncbi:MAG: tripartite tricarboxylate transporter TctB family protein [Roseicyclus sp.]|jgi:hypothetical protein